MRSCVFGINGENFTAPKVNHCVVLLLMWRERVVLGDGLKNDSVFECL